MPRPRQPIELIELKGKKHLTKAEIERRRAGEVRAPSDDISPPGYLTGDQKNEFQKIAEQLIGIGIMTNLDCDALARFIVAQDNYIKFTKIVNDVPGEWEMVSMLEKATSIQDRAFKQCRAAAADLGLTISSRCKLAVPQKEEPAESKWDKFKGASSG